MRRRASTCPYISLVYMGLHEALCPVPEVQGAAVISGASSCTRSIHLYMPEEAARGPLDPQPVSDMLSIHPYIHLYLARHPNMSRKCPLLSLCIPVSGVYPSRQRPGSMFRNSRGPSSGRLPCPSESLPLPYPLCILPSVSQ